MLRLRGEISKSELLAEVLKRVPSEKLIRYYVRFESNKVSRGARRKPERIAATEADRAIVQGAKRCIEQVANGYQQIGKLKIVNPGTDDVAYVAH